MITLAYALGAYTLLCLWLIWGRGPFRLTYNPVVAWGLGKLNVVAICIGARGYLRLPLDQWSPEQLEELERHEGTHYRKQWCKWGPLFLPIYFVLLLIYSYDRHPWEQAARRAAGEPER